LARGVIKPQYGHILCDWNCCDCGLNNASSFAKKAKTGFIDFTFAPTMPDQR
jgi:hypothetical protein